MFTGIIEGMGKIADIRRLGSESRFTLQPLYDMKNIIDGESIAINGVCLSVERHNGQLFTVYASPETMALTNLAALREGQKVNLERAVKAGDRLGGHIMSGHVDCMAILRRKQANASSIKMRLEFPQKFTLQVVAKGSVALNGISLTVNSCGPDWLEVNIIPDSQKRTNISAWEVGAGINMETDIIGKYVQRMVAPFAERPAPEGIATFDLLARNGFL